jgi:sulfur carrier protein ThiS
MNITVKSYASMKKYLAGLPPDGALDIREGSPVGAVLKQLGVPPEVKKVVLVNGRHCSQQCVLRAGDILVFFPPLEGG